MSESSSDTLLAKLAKLREPFPSHQVSKLPKPTRAQTDAVKRDFKVGIRCGLCGAWHHPDVVHLDYVGHAAITNRLLDVDPSWSWDPVSITDSGMPALDHDGGMWIKLTICGISRIGYGHADGKSGGDATKERIGDAIRNAAMRFGCALELWHKGELHITPFSSDLEAQQHFEQTYPKPEAPAEAPAEPVYPEDNFKANFPVWKQRVESGVITPARIITMASSKGKLSDEQLKAINSLVAKP